MKHNKAIIFSIGILSVCILLIAGIFFLLPLDIEPPVSQPLPTIEYLEEYFSNTTAIIALQPISEGSRIEVGSIGHRVNTGNPPPSTIISEAEALNRIAKVDIIPGQLILRSMFIPSNEEVLDAGCFSINESIRVCRGHYEESSYIYRVDETSKQEIWRLNIGGIALFTLAVDETQVYFWGSDSQLHAVDIESGRMQWEYRNDNVQNITVFTRPDVIGDNLIFWSESNGQVYALDTRTGQQRWQFKLDERALGPRIVTDGIISFADKQTIYNLDIKTGEEVGRETW